MTGAIHVVAVEARTPVGLTAESSAAGIRGRISRIVEHPFMVDLRGDPVRAGMDGRLKAALFGRVRMRRLAKSSLEALADKVGLLFPRLSAPLLLGLPEPRPGWSEDDAAWLVEELSKPATNREKRSVYPLLLGHAAALDAMREAIERMRAGMWDVVIVGGVDSYLHPEALTVADGQERLLGEHVRSGFVPGEGAAFALLATDRALASLALPSLARIETAHSAKEANVVHGSGVNGADGLTAALLAATAVLEAGTMIDDIYCDLNGERYRTEEWGFALLRTAHLWRDPSRCRTFTAECGDLGAASGAMSVVLAVEAWRKKYGRGSRAIAWASSEGGLRSAALLRRSET